MSTLEDFVEDDNELPDRVTLYDPELNTRSGGGMRRLNNERKRIETSTELSEEEKKGLTEYDEELRNNNNKLNNRGAGTRALYLSLGRLMQKTSGLFLDTSRPGEAGEQALDELLEHVTSQDHGGNYVHNMMISIKTYGELCGHESNQDAFDDITPAKYRKENKPPNPGNVLTWNDALDMSKTQDHLRNQAMILTYWGSGGRPKSELWELKFKHVHWAGDHYKITMPWTGKTGERTINMHPGAPTLRKWIEDGHPVHNDPDDSLGPETYLWTQLNKNEQLSYQMITNIFSGAGEAAGINKDHNPRHLRRSRFSYLAGKPTISEDDLRFFGGWEFESPAPRAYIAKHSKDNQRNISMADGASDGVMDDLEAVAPITCNHCSHLTERHLEDCIRCGGTVDEDLHGDAYNLNDPVTEGKSVVEIIREDGITGSDIESLEKMQMLIKHEGEKIFDDLESWKDAADGINGENCMTGPSGLVAQLSAAVSTAAGSAVEAWGRAKAKAIEIHPEMIAPSQMSTERKAWFYTSMVAAISVMLVLLYLDGSLQALAAGDPVEWFGVIFAIAFWKWLMDRNLPDIEEARAAAAEDEE